MNTEETTLAPRLTVDAIQGLDDTVNALRLFSPDLLAELGDEMREIMREVADGAIVRFPIGPNRWGEGHGVAGYKVRKTRGSQMFDRIGYTAYNANKSAAITEFAGRVSAGKTTRGQSLIRSLNARYGTAGRFLWASWDERAAAALTRLRAAVAVVEAEFESRLGRTSG